MSIRSMLGPIGVTLFMTTFASIAFARQPPALVEAQQTSDQALCAGSDVRFGAGYRDAATRFGTRRPSSEVARAGAGYRDAVARFGATNADTLVACGAPHVARLSASR